MSDSIPLPFQWIELGFSVLAGGVLTIAASLYALYRWEFGPKFIIGVPPTTRERTEKGFRFDRVGRTSITSQIRHKPDCMAQHLREKEELNERDRHRLFHDRLRCRSVIPDSDGNLRLPVVVENYGRREAVRFTLGITIFHRGVHVVDVLTESHEVESLYEAHPSLVNPTTSSLPITPAEIDQAYKSYIETPTGRTEQGGDMVYISGSEDGWMQEIVLMTVHLEQDVSRFVIGYTIDWSDGSNSPVSKKALFQGFAVNWHPAAAS